MSISVAHAGSSTIKEAEKVSMILSRNMDNHDEAYRFRSLIFLAQVSSRNLCIENFLFNINWKSFLVVSISCGWYL